MPSYFPENNVPKPDDTEVRSLQKINDLLQDGITVVVGEVEIKNDSGVPLSVSDRGTTGTQLSNFSSLTSLALANTNANRKLLTVFNEGAGILYVLYGSGTASATNYSVRMNSGDYLEVDKYTGQVTAIFASAGTARVTEITN